MAKKLKISTEDMLNIELNYMKENNIEKVQIGNEIHFYNYCTEGLAVLVSIDDNNEYITAQGNRKYAILKGSYTARRMNNKVQLNLLNKGIIEPVEINGSKCYRFVKTSEVLSTSSVMLALTVSANPSVGKYNFTEDKRLCINLKEAEHAQQSDSSKESKEAAVADGLTDEATKELFNNFIKAFMEEDSPVMEAFEKKIYEVQQAKAYRQKHTYHVKSFDGKFETVDIYKDSLLKEAKEILERTGRLLIVGDTGSGKSELAYKLIADITGEKVGISGVEADYYRVCIANARDGESFWCEDDNKSTLGKLRLFAEHIRKNNITEPCVFVGNEIQASDFGALIGNRLFERFNSPERIDESLIPSNLYIIFTGCDHRDLGIDNQVYGRVGHVKLEYLADGTGSGEVDAVKIIKNLGGKNPKRAIEIVNLVSEINAKEKEYNYAAVISTRELIKKLKGQITTLIPKSGDKEYLTSDSQKLLEKLVGL